jgi:hypothetical protein
MLDAETHEPRSAIPLKSLHWYTRSKNGISRWFGLGWVGVSQAPTSVLSVLSTESDFLTVGV